ncbi:MAG: AAA family ATPase [Bdellovibrionaceae bacterium]|nr:AAA family ATPase [Pseudobdellovibrionaceae bacterium]
MNFTWQDFFHELFIKIVSEFDSKSLAELVYRIFPENAMMDRDENNRELRFEEFDPCSFLARFNRQERTDKKIEYCIKAKEILKLTSNIPQDFNGIPIFNNMRWMFFPFKKERSKFEYEALWAFSKKLAEGEITRETLNNARKSFGAGLTYLTTIAYIVWPEKYLPLDDRTKSYLQKRAPFFEDMITSAKRSEEPFELYHSILKKLPDVIPGKTCADISYSAYLEDINKDSKPSGLTNIIKPNEIRYWSIAPGENAEYWHEWQQKNLISIGWNELGDLSKQDSLDEVGKIYKKKYKPEGSAKNNILANFEFAHRLKIGDVVFVKKGRTELLGVGRVISDYKFAATEIQSHTRQVEWMSIGTWKLKSDKFAIKTLTDITEYESFVENLLKLSGLDDSSIIGDIVNKLKEPSMNKNTIFWGPPGTGKTYKLLQLQNEFEDQETSTASDQVVQWVQDTDWWDVVAAAMYEIGKPVSVPELFEHEFIQIKAKQSSTKTPKNTLWAMLQTHTVQDSVTVKYGRRQEPLVVDKSEDSKWFLTGNWEEQLSDLVSEIQSLRDVKTVKRYEMVTFHQSYSYEEFVEGIRPEIQSDGNSVSYQVKDGIFKKLCQRAIENPDKNYAIFIDEINRGNISKIFGELITLIEEDKRLGAPHEVTITLPYSGKKFGVPNNLYIIGTMNSVDRSIALVDMALRRRFDFISIRPDSSLLSNSGIHEFDVRSIFEKLNNKISVILGTEYQVGHSYFMDKNVGSIASFKKIWFGGVLPLLQEYLFDDWDKLEALVGSFVKKTEVKDLENLSLPKFSFGSFIENNIADEVFIEFMKKLE